MILTIRHCTYYLFDTDNELVLGQLPVDEKTNEITVMPDLIDLLDLKDTIITADALNCQKEIVEKIVDKKGRIIKILPFLLAKK